MGTENNFLLQFGSEMNNSGIGEINTDGMDPVTRNIVLSPEFHDMVNQILKDEVSLFVTTNLHPSLQPTAQLYIDEFINTAIFKDIIVGAALRNPNTCNCPEKIKNPPYFKDSQRLPLPPGIRPVDPNGPNPFFNDSQGVYSWQNPLPKQTLEEQMQEDAMIAGAFRRASQDGNDYQGIQNMEPIGEYGAFAQGINASGAGGQSTPPNGPTRNSSAIEQFSDSTFGIPQEQMSPQQVCQQSLNASLGPQPQAGAQNFQLNEDPQPQQNRNRTM